MIRSTLTERDNVVDFHLRMGVAACCAVGGNAHRFDIVGADIANSANAGPSVLRTGSPDFFRSLWVRYAPPSGSSRSLCWMLLSVFTGTLGGFGQALRGGFVFALWALLYLLSVLRSIAGTVLAKFVFVVRAPAPLIRLVAIGILAGPFFGALTGAQGATGIGRVAGADVPSLAWLASEVVNETAGDGVFARDKIHAASVMAAAYDNNYRVA